MKEKDKANYHVPVLLAEAIEALQIKADGIYVELHTNSKNQHKITLFPTFDMKIKKFNFSTEYICLKANRVASFS